MTARILCIGGSDSGGGAGIQADTKTITMLGGYAMTAITALTAQNTVEVSNIMLASPESVTAQIDAVVSDIGVDAVKIGMIGSAAIAEAVWQRLTEIRIASPDLPVVLDPVMVATSGATLADAEAILAMRRMMALATLVTPNLPELDVLGGEDRLRHDGQCVLIKGGHGLAPLVTDRLIGADGDIASWSAPRIETRHTHGTGCTLASAIACGLGQGHSLIEAIERARQFVRLALQDVPRFGTGHGPMGHHAVRLDCGVGLRLNQITVGADDYAASVAFYQMLGLRLIVDSPPRYARLESPGGVTLSIHAESEVQSAGSVIIYFECNSIDQEVQRLESLGVAFDQLPIDQTWLWREALLRDPFGNTICLYQAGEMRRYPPWRV